MSIIDEFIAAFMQHIRKCEVFYPMIKYLGIELVYDDCYVRLAQDIQITKVTENFPKASRDYEVPMSSTIKLNVATPNIDNESLLPLTGSLRFIVDRTRPDMLAALGELSSGASVSPSDEHMKASEQIVKYLDLSRAECLCLGGKDKSVTLFGFVDASYITTGKSISRLGGCLFLGLDSGAIHSFSKKETTVSHSSTEAELKALDEIVRVIIHVRNLLSFIGYKQSLPTVVHIDNKSAIELCKTLRTTSKTRHINIVINFIREQINLGVVRLLFVPTLDNVADILTKPLARELYTKHQATLMKGFGGVPRVTEAANQTTYEDVLLQLSRLDDPLGSLGAKN